MSRRMLFSPEIALRGRALTRRFHSRISLARFDSQNPQDEQASLPQNPQDEQTSLSRTKPFLTLGVHQDGSWCLCSDCDGTTAADKPDAGRQVEPTVACQERGADSQFSPWPASEERCRAGVRSVEQVLCPLHGARLFFPSGRLAPILFNLDPKSQTPCFLTKTQTPKLHAF